MVRVRTISYSVEENDVDKTAKKLSLTKERTSLTTCEKCVYTAIHFCIHITFGLSLSSMAPAFVDFKHILNTEMRWIGLFPTFQAIGTLLGSCFTLSYKWMNRQITLSILVIGMGLGTIFQPWSISLWQLYLCIFVYGLGIGAWNGANNVILIEMWQKRSPSVLQFSQFIYGIGTILGPLLAQSYVIGEMQCPGVYPQHCSDNNTYLVLNLNVSEANATISACTEQCLHYDRRPTLKIPFLIAGLIQMIGPCLMLLMYIIRKYEYNNESDIEVVVTAEQKERYRKYVPRKTILACIAAFFAFGIMSETMYTDFSATFFQYQRILRLTAAKSAQIFSTMSIALSLGRGLSVFIALVLKPQYMIGYEICIVFAGYLFQIFGQDHLPLLWASAIVICFGYSSIFICLFSFVGQYTEVTDKIGGLFIASSNAIYLFLPYFISEYIVVDPDSFLYIEIASLSVGILAFIVVLIAVRNVPGDLIRKLGPVGGH